MNAYLPHASFLGRQLIDPRGRCNRQGFLALAIALLALQTLGGLILGLAGERLDGSLALTLNAPLFWIGAMATLKRLHDMGRSGWWVLASATTWCIYAIGLSFTFAVTFGPQSIAQGTFGFWILFAMIVLPAFGALLFLHAAPGEDRTNRYGDAPGDLGFTSAPKRETGMDGAAVAG